MTEQEKAYELVVEDMRELYDGKLSDVEAHEAARNFIEFTRIIIEVLSKADVKN